MLTVHPEYLVDDKQKRKSVVLPLVEWECIVDELEELDDIRAYDADKSKSEESIPFEDAVREIEEGYGA